jgi:hypothetical protein
MQRPSDREGPCRPQVTPRFSKLTLGADWRWHGADLVQDTQRTKPACLLAVISHVVNAKIFVVSTKARRAARRDLLSPISRLSLNEGLSAPRFALRSRRRKSCRSVSDYLQGRWRLVDAGRFTRRAQFPKCTLGSKQRALPSFGGAPSTICPPLATTWT